jgi:nitrite reductase/ring-hydroxylating ferredoxin subunit
LAFQRVAKTHDVPSGRGLAVRVGGREIGIFRVGERYFALDNACPHAGAPLSEGDLDGSTIICTAHGWEFDVCSGLAAHSFVAPIPCFAVRVEGDDLLLDVGPERGEGSR